MYFAKALLVGASFAVAAVAQTTKLAFTTLPTSVTAGSSTELKWTGGDGTVRLSYCTPTATNSANHLLLQAVTIILQQGTANNLQTVQIVTGKPSSALSRVVHLFSYYEFALVLIFRSSGSASGNSYTWTPSKSLPSGENYALKITQGTSAVNYSGLFSLSGGSASSSSSSSSASSTDSSSMSVTPVVPVPLPSTQNSTTTTMPSYNATTTAIVGTGIVGTGIGASASAGTGIPMSRNTTMSMATLTSTATTSSSATTSGGSTSGSKAPSASPTKAPSSAAGLGSPLAFVLSAFIAVVYLG